MGDGAMGDDPAPGDDVPIGVGVAEQRRQIGAQHGDEGQQGDAERQRDAEAAAVRGGGGEFGHEAAS